MKTIYFEQNRNTTIIIKKWEVQILSNISSTFSTHRMTNVNYGGYI